MKFNFFRGGGGGGNLSIPVFQPVNRRSLSNFPPKRGGAEEREVSQTLLARITRNDQLLARVSKTVFFRTFFNKSLA